MNAAIARPQLDESSQTTMPAGAPIELAPYSPMWPQRFATERSVLAAIFPAPAFRIEHIGSTAVPGLPAKPIIDILLGAPALADVEARIPALHDRGYLYRPEFETALPQRRYFVKPAAQPHDIHVHATETGSAFWNEHLLFRDALRDDARLAGEYLALKDAMAALHRNDRLAYTDAKAPFIRSVVERAIARRGHGSPFDRLLPRSTGRLTLRRFAHGDLARFQSYRCDPDVGRYQGWSALDDAGAAVFLDEMATASAGVPGHWFQVAVAERATDALIGDIGLGFDATRAGIVEIGISMATAAQRQGLGAEAVAGALALLFESGVVDVVEGVTDARNAPSIRLLERVGMRLVRTEDAMFKGEMCTERVYAIGRMAWHSRDG